jgi:hypothetical protein
MWSASGGNSGHNCLKTCTTLSSIQKHKFNKDSFYDSHQVGKNKTMIWPDDSSQAFSCSEETFDRLKCPCLPDVPDNSVEFDELIQRLPVLFFHKLGTVKGMVCHLDVTDSTSVCSLPYQCFHPRLQILRETVKDLFGLSC